MDKIKKAKIERAGKTDGRLFRVERDDVRPGSVLRTVQSDGSSDSFSDMTVLSVSAVPPSSGPDMSPAGARSGYQEVVLARPYLYATASGSALTGVETIKVEIQSLLKEDSRFRVVVTSLGVAADYVR